MVRDRAINAGSNPVLTIFFKINLVVSIILLSLYLTIKTNTMTDTNSKGFLFAREFEDFVNGYSSDNDKDFVEGFKRN